jgi:hypothetical protein
LPGRVIENQAKLFFGESPQCIPERVAFQYTALGSVSNVPEGWYLAQAWCAWGGKNLYMFEIFRKDIDKLRYFSIFHVLNK